MAWVLSQVRWYLKKGARATVVLLAWGSGWLVLRRWLSRGPRVRVLMYHRFRHAPRDPFSVSPAAFAQQMEWIAQHHLAVSLADLEAFLAGRCDLPDGAVLVTVDDGYDDLWSQAVPVLQRLGIPAVAFIPSGEVASDVEAHDDESAMEGKRLGWKAIMTLPMYGITVGSHAWNHRSLSRMARDQVYFQASQSRQELATRLHCSISAFAYPFGTRADYNAMTVDVLREVGYTCAFTAQHGAIRPGAPPYTLPRVKIEGGEGLWLFRLILQGGLDAWAWIDRTLWWLQQGEKC